ncbi:low molecular weight protein-tyrosine-phosphatase [Roseateles saccharophilus]|uniref:protein-tyrosine-phosphatase n=1 Tax=Roseateles saccharophilus TaxID=304 RepID=A0A4R3UXT9_ROSSA|nr:low molecular weight protein-tyrosine-phosphatase [Roseateles saccharophilus]MDG0832421.1 low molecular weight phosphotyrosine protein phosphatase [Roseateles saccharophilus]TCU97116.1 protein tyrosine phosphatase [Roseateles saccharophilus]
MTVRRILFFCMGNICRSPTAEGVMRARLTATGLDVEVDSAGTHGWHAGEPPDGRSQAHALRRGYDLGALRARQLEAADFDHFDLVLAMDDDNLIQARRLCPPARRERLKLLMDYAPGTGSRIVPDPYYGGEADFERVLDLVEAACDGLLASLSPAPRTRPA